jgi:hypothetical protein
MWKHSQNLEKFIGEIIDLCEKYNLSLPHENRHSAFIVEGYCKEKIEWLKNAFDRIQERK